MIFTNVQNPDWITLELIQEISKDANQVIISEQLEVSNIKISE